MRPTSSPTFPPQPVEPEIPEDVTPADLPREVRAELRSASKPTADFVACHLVMAGRLIDEDPRAAYAHADAARRRLPRIAGVREAMGLCAYACEEWAEALAELRAARRMSGSYEHLAVMADCERGLGRPERALALAATPEAATLDPMAAVELRLVVAGARRDLGQLDAAVVSLQGPDLEASRRDPWSVRLFYAYADALLAADREDEAREWFLHTAVADVDDETDAAERIDLIDGIEIGEIVEVGDTDPTADIVFEHESLADLGSSDFEGAEFTKSEFEKSESENPQDEKPEYEGLAAENADFKDPVEGTRTQLVTAPVFVDPGPAIVTPVILPEAQLSLQFFEAGPSTD